MQALCRFNAPQDNLSCKATIGKGCADGDAVIFMRSCVLRLVESPKIAPQASRKEVIQPQVPLRLPCYDFTPVADLTVVGCFPNPKTGVSAPP